MAVLWLALCLIAQPAVAQARGPVVLAAASMQEALDEAATVWAGERHSRPVISYAASSALARQVIAGAPADLYVSADEAWVDAVAKAGHVADGSRAVMAGNRLVLVGPVRSRVRQLRTGNDIVAALGNRHIAMADPDSVPAGRYGKVALQRMGAWTRIAPRVARAENVRAALALVQRGAAPLGIVYATDARAQPGVRVVGVFPAASHPPIRYPVVRLARSRHREAEAFRRFLLSRQGRAILIRHGFSVP